MKTMKRTGLGVAMTLALPAAAIADDLRIGIAASLTGAYAPYAEVEGARCMADRLNAAGQGPKIELMIEDTRSEPQLSVTIAQKFLDRGAQVVTGIPFPDSLIPIAQIAEATGATVFSAPNTQVEMQIAGFENFIAGAVPDPVNGAATAEAAYAAGARNVVLLKSADAGSWSEMLPEWFGQSFEHLGGTVSGRLSHSIGTSDWSPQIAQIRAMSPAPDAVMISSVLPDIGILIRQLRANGFNGLVIGSDGFDDPSLEGTVTDPATLEQVIFGTHGPTGTGGRIDDFLADCRSKGFAVQGIFDALGADMVLQTHAAAMRAGSVDPVAIRQALRAEGGNPGITAEVISYAENGGAPVKTVPVIGFRNGKRVVLQDRVPAFVPDWR
ncbi:amino acid/amide ABC transporter substrate-binding protein, HAAT family [Gemmobacter megaterium]|uniref:Amino acid/amide ABC transporter substrate-binding protein, HAAT family n=2 Tax=Gemmobacter megaterium TaxID=1086013 RepID=A0A1N7N248_9RHOB|nr:amino acid ABC transporter substrate-binding protein [Gemmobacter megaterium]SIS92271.1 amino acid/amide ABC transporter substrate-binding protein, HAAT family [Gemmobacter megaterium]